MSKRVWGNVFVDFFHYMLYNIMKNYIYEVLLMDIKNLCFDLADTPSVAGNEGRVIYKLKEQLEKYMVCHIDRLGNLIGTAGGGDIHILRSCCRTYCGNTIHSCVPEHCKCPNG